MISRWDLITLKIKRNDYLANEIALVSLITVTFT